MSGSARPVNPISPRRLVLFDHGFRPFFLLSGLYAMFAVPLWLWVWSYGVVPLTGVPPMLWHGHEMLYGFVMAAAAGFLLTAVPSWTGTRGFAGWPLQWLVIAWLAGRLVFLVGNALPFWLVGVIELSFLPLLAAMLAPPLMRAGNRNAPLLAVICVLWLLDAAFLVAVHSTEAAWAQRALHLGIDCVLILVTVIGGRIVPSFTGNALRHRGETTTVVMRAWLEPLVIGLMIAVAIVDAIRPTSLWSGGLAIAAAVAHGIRLWGWRGVRIRDQPILWVLHVGYAWLPVGFALKALALLTPMQWPAHWQHAFTMGVFGTMILAVMTRASLGHTGRPLSVARSIVGAYLLLSAGVLVRVFGPAMPLDYRWIVSMAGALWVAAFLMFTVVYAPILTGPRVDGKTG